MARLTGSSGTYLGRLESSDVPAAARLSATVGWNQDEVDWDRLVSLYPDGVFAARHQGRLVGTATLAYYGEDLAWLGMVIVDPGWRGKGLGAALIDAALATAPGTAIGLDATDLGAPLYLRRGFTSVGSVERWTGVVQPVAASRGASGYLVRQAHVSDAAALVTFDLRESDIDRSRLLLRLLGEPSTSMVLVERGAAPVAYAVLRTGREQHHVGPVVAKDDAALIAVMNGVASVVGSTPVFVDVPGDGRPTAGVPSSNLATGNVSPGRLRPGGTGESRRMVGDWPAAFGLSLARSLRRMVRLEPDGLGQERPPGSTGSRAASLVPSARRVLIGSSLAAATGLEWG